MDITFTLGANVENLDLNGGAAINGTGNALANTINGNDAVNQLFGGGGDDTINGNDGNDIIDGGGGNDAINGGDDSDTIIGGAGNDTINTTNGNDSVRYTASNFGADIITGFDATGGSAATQDLIDLSALGITSANLATRVIESTVAGNTILTVRDASLATIGTIQVNGITNANIDATDYILAAAPPALFGVATAAANTITGNAAANTINGAGGNDALSGAGGNDVINGDEGADTLNGGDGNDTLTGGTGSDVGTYADNFNAQAYNNSDGTVPWTTSWIEASDVTTGTVATNGAIQIIGGATDNLRFGGVTNDANGATLTRGIDLTGATSASVSYTANPDNLDAGENLTVWFAANGTTFVQIDTITGDAPVTRNIPLAGAFGANSAIQFRVTGVNNTNEIISVDTVAVTITRPGLNTGVDTINGDAGDDTIIWNANPSGPTDGRDVIDGGTEGAAGDTFVVNGNASSETYNIYTRTAWQELGNSLAAFNAATEIIVARGGLTNADVIAELREIEEIRINSVDPSGTTGPAGNDAFNIVGDFAATSLRLNTITIDGNAGDDTIDITSLDFGSSHRVPLKWRQRYDYRDFAPRRCDRTARRRDDRRVYRDVGQRDHHFDEGQQQRQLCRTGRTAPAWH